MINNQDVNCDYLNLLNPQQRAAVEYIDGPSLVIAGAGSGKTRVLTYKILHLLHCGYEPYRILALTFTNKAANEMKQRIVATVGEKVASQVWMGTFHSVFLRILRRYHKEIGFQPGFTIYDSTDSRSLLKMIIKELGLDEKVYKPAVLASIISNAKNSMVLPEEYLRDHDYIDRDKKSKRPLTGRIYQLYCQRCYMANAMDFDDILVFMNYLLTEEKLDYIRQYYQELFKYILVDEYQDINFAQHLVITQLVGDNQKLCVVGDDAQSIYSFRGANISNILNLNRKYPSLKIFKLERNYRSTQNIINAAGSLIEKNTQQMKKNVYSENEVGKPVDVIKSYSDLEEAYMVTSLISNSKLTFHDSYDNYAVLYRTNAQSRVLEESLRKRNIPYRIYGGLSFYQRKEIKDIVSYFRMAINPDDDEALRRIINYPARGIGDTTMKKLTAAAVVNNVSVWKILCDIDKYQISVNSGTKRKLNDFQLLIETFINDNKNGSNAFELGQLIYNRTGILTSLAHDSTPESISRQENLSEMLSGLKEFVDSRIEAGEENIDMTSFLSEIMLASDLDQKDEVEGPKVTLMTVHAAKGLEFEHVYVVGVEEDLFPSAMSMNSLAEVEEERRLLYVAMTRAKKTCSLLYAGTRFRNGQTVMTRPSRFLSDINRKFLKISSSANIDAGTKTFVNPLSNYNSSSKNSYVSNISSSSGRKLRPISELSKIKGPDYQVEGAENLKEGSVIEHPRFGLGTVRKISMMSDERVATVDFGHIGEKKLLLKFAKFKIVKF